MSLPAQRLRSQLLAGNAAATPHAVVAHMAAVQAQDYLGALWAVGVRMRKAVEEDVERALAERTIVRCWPMRGTLHFVAAEDVRWMLDLLAPRVLSRHRARLERDFDLDKGTLSRCRTLVERALTGGHSMTRSEIYALLEKARIATGSSRGLHILFALAHERLLCFGARRGKQPTFVLLDEWLPASKPRPREESLADLARRYAAGHAPATVADFAWWSGLSTKEANEAVALADVRLDEIASARELRSVHLLPPFDEYTVAYKERAAIVDSSFAKKVNAGGGMLNAIVVVNGRVAGTWKRELRGGVVDIRVSVFAELSASAMRALEREASRYGTFLGRDRAIVTAA
ncbi:MAG TPA: winged helix DNA-binding domain-containing protein [Thermoanaerobaculia bacterium]|nr:winged helix DNA-binding domain-containing protein [Thermoanaerobaculia bacterium]